jgi:hypothetical protein
MYVLPKSLESVWVAARGKGYVMRTGELGEALVSDPYRIRPSIADSFFPFLPAHCNRHGYGYGKRFATLSPSSANRGPSPFYFLSIDQRTYQHDPHHLSGIVRRILYQFVGPN